MHSYLRSSILVESLLKCEMLIVLMDAIDFDFIICQHSASQWSKRSDTHLTLISGCFLVILQIDLEDELAVLVSDLHIAWLGILNLHEMHGAHTRIHKVILHASWLITPRLFRQL